jgi:DNA modification methylase
MSLIVVNGDNLQLLKKYPDNHFDAIVTDPPYGLGKEPDAVEVMTAWATTGYHEIEGKGFMGKEWDAFVPQPVFWKEVFRVLKHGGHVVAFYGTRTYDWGVMAMRFAGFEVRDCIQWLYGSGFPKSHNIGKAIDKLEGNERKVIGKGISGSTAKGFNLNDQQREAGTGIIAGEYTLSKGNSAWEGWGSALKPANEPIVLARKPLEKGLSIAENVLKWGTGGINIDGCRIGYSKDDHLMKYEGYQNGTYKSEYEEGTSYKYGNQVQINPMGRFPANIILTHHPECECKGVKKVGKGERKQHEDGEVSNANEGYRRPNKSSYTHKNSDVIASYGEETVEDWNCHPDCPIKILDEQSGISKSTGGSGDKSMGGLGVNGKYGKYALNVDAANKGGLGDTGGASRFFYVAKASKSERNKGLEGFENKKRADINKMMGESGNFKTGSGNDRTTEFKNFHPTVKPVKLMQYLIRLVTPPNGIVLDPFCGSGTTGVACKLEGFQFVGMEQDPEYAKIAEARIKNYKEEKENPIEQKIDTINSKFTQQTLF